MVVFKYSKIATGCPDRDVKHEVRAPSPIMRGELPGQRHRIKG